MTLWAAMALLRGAAKPHEVTITTTHSLTYLYVRHDVFRVAVFMAVCSLLVNFLPRADALARWPRWQWVYCWVIDFLAFCAGNWRSHLPSLDLRMMGFAPDSLPARHVWTRRRRRTEARRRNRCR